MSGPDIPLSTAVLAEITKCSAADVAAQPVRSKISSCEGGCLEGLSVVTFWAATKGRQPDDAVYAASPWMREHVPRGFSAVIKIHPGGTFTLVTVMQGPRKFEGVSKADNDDVKESDEASQIYDAAKISQWQTVKKLQVVRTTKENGKFAVVRMFQYEGHTLAVGGSKNVHVVVSRSSLPKVVADAEAKPLLSQIFLRVGEQWDTLAAMSERLPGHTLVGELCDGKHFVPIPEGEPVVKWFGLFKRGVPIDPVVALAELSSVHLPVVGSDVLPADSDIGLIIRQARCGPGEGYVLYFSNTETGDAVLAKSKTSVYIVKRMAREALKSGGYCLRDRLPRRLTDAAQYHLLTPQAAARICMQFFDFEDWLMASRLPVTTVDMQPPRKQGDSSPPPPSSPEGRGFAWAWQRFLEASGQHDASVTPADLLPDGVAFDAGEFRRLISVDGSGERSLKNHGAAGMPIVAFLQGLQGSGKSALGAQVAALLGQQGMLAELVEQDQFWGDTLSCRSYMEHLIRRRQDVGAVLVTRCNANEKQYGSYVAAATRLGARVSFYCPKEVRTPLSAAVALASVVERSQGLPPGLLGLGTSLLPPLEVAKIILRVQSELSPHPQAHRYNILSTPPEQLESPEVSAAPEALISLVEAEGPRLLALRRPLGEQAAQLLPLLMDPPAESLVRPSLEDCNLIAFYAVDRTAEAELTDMVRDRNPEASCSRLHLTQMVLPFDRKKRRQGLQDMPHKPHDFGYRISVDVTHLVTRRSDGMMALRVAVPEGMWVQSGRPHITAHVPQGAQAVHSLQFVHEEEGDEVIVEDLIPTTLEMECIWS